MKQNNFTIEYHKTITSELEAKLKLFKAGNDDSVVAIKKQKNIYLSVQGWSWLLKKVK